MNNTKINSEPVRPGDWEHLDDPGQAPRYEAIASMLAKAEMDGSVLDVGCGTCELRNYLPLPTRYCGVEPSSEAVEVACSRWGAMAHVCHMSAELCRFDSSDQFDAAVFNESLYYCTDPVGLLRRYASYLRPGGAILVSIWQKPRRLWHPSANVLCDRMVRRFVDSESWLVISERIVTAPVAEWHIYLVRPTANYCPPITC